MKDAPSRSGLLALEAARGYVGNVEEHPPGSNRGVPIDKWNRAAGVPVGSYWCMSFVYAMFKASGTRNIIRTASVGFFLSWAHDQGFVVKRPRKGDAVCFFFDRATPSWPSHVGIIERVLSLGPAFWLQTIEGNTSSGDIGSQDNGGGVYRRRRLVKRASFVRVP